ncbi:MAG TPA: glycosyltransferase family 1 protein [Patescibacteria group bacterium]|nr:glycosyltransferase family 1 protein [Patescibacteria group bacterium]
MIIGVDAGALSITDDRLKVGVYRVTLHLLRELARMDMKNTYRLYSFSPIDRGVISELGDRMTNVVITPARGWFTVRLPIELTIHPVDVFLGVSQAIPRSTSHNIGFIYDLGFLFNPDAYGNAAQKLKTQTQSLVERADSIVTISNTSKKDILREYTVDQSKVTVAYPGVDSLFSPIGVAFQSTNPYVLFVGSLNKAKDLSLAIRAFSLAMKRVKKPYDFLLVGGDYWPDSRIDKTIQELGLERRVKKIGLISDSELPKYYRGATALFTTPLHEGFCLPAVESMACGTPVISVDRGAMKEIVGGGGLVSRNAQEVDIANTLYQFLSDDALQKKIRVRAIERSRKFRWKTFASQIYNLLAYYEH